VSEPTHGSAQGEQHIPEQATGASGDGTHHHGTDAFRRRSDRHKESTHRHPWIRRGIFTVAALLVVTLVLGIGAYLKLTGNIHRIDITGQLGTRPQHQVTTDAHTNLAPVNIMVMGSDTRAGQGGAFDRSYKQGDTGARSDTNLVVHLSADRKSAIVVSIPRDSMTMAPTDCKNKADTVKNGAIRQWNANFTLGGPACTIRTFEGLTGVYIDHFVVIDFRGFQSMVDALGGVSVCTPVPINDQASHLVLPAGKSRLNGQQALGYVRVRHIGDGSDLQRIDRQQAFMSSVIQEATKSSLLLRPDKLFSFLNAATSAMTTDKGLDLGQMKDIAQSVRAIGLSQIRFVKLPTRPYPADPNRVEWTSAADTIWSALRNDTPLPGTKGPSGTTSATASPTSTAPLTVSPAGIKVRVSNDSGVPGLAKQAADAMRVQGFSITSFVTGTGTPTHGVVVRYGPAMAEAARTVAAVFPGAQTREDPLLGSTLEISMGVDSPNAVAVSNRLGTQPLPKPSITATAGPSATATVKARTASQDICS
jgi:LCP family protein required for cell wall assembly